MKETRKQDIVKAAVELFAQKGFRGTTTRDLAAHAEVNEAIIFRHFKTKEELYRAILEERLSQMRDLPCAVLDEMARDGDDKGFLETVGQQFLAKHEQDATFMRLLLFSALEGHELSDMFVSALASRDPLAEYFQRRMAAGVMREMDPQLTARLFIGMFVSFVQQQEIFGLKKTKTFDRNEVVRNFVSIFLTGIKQ